MNFWLTSAFLLGLLSSLHCIGMCGPLMIATLTTPQVNATQGYKNFILYQTGRLLIYTLLGFLFGLLGESIKLQTSQRFISVITGIIILTVWYLPKLKIHSNIKPTNYISKFVIKSISINSKTNNKHLKFFLMEQLMHFFRAALFI